MNSNPITDCLLLQALTQANAMSDSIGQVREFCARAQVSMHLEKVAFNPDKNLLYAYLQLQQRQEMSSEALVSVITELRSFAPALTELSLSRMQIMLDVQGHSSGVKPHFHYIVETDPEAGWFDEIAHWYDTEHMIGLARVEGCIQARRMLNHDQGPISLACYDLVTEETLGSEPWLAVRWTDWSSKVRPHFTNTKRTMFNFISQSPT